MRPSQRPADRDRQPLVIYRSLHLDPTYYRLTIVQYAEARDSTLHLWIP